MSDDEKCLCCNGTGNAAHIPNQVNTDLPDSLKPIGYRYEQCLMCDGTGKTKKGLFFDQFK